MIRRRSHLISLHFFKIFWKYFLFKFNKLTLKQSVRYKRYSWKFTKIKRKPWALRKRSGIWYHYALIINTWSLHYQKLKQITKSTFLWQTFKYNFVSVNPFHYSSSDKIILDYKTLYHSFSISKKILLTFKKKNPPFFSIFFSLKYLNKNIIMLPFFPEQELIKHDIMTSNSYNVYDDRLSFTDSELFLDKNFKKVLQLITNPWALSPILPMILEFYKVLINLFLQKIK